MGQLTALAVKNAKVGRHADGDGLYLLVRSPTAKSWMLRVQTSGRRRDYGLGALSAVSLAEARDKAAEYRRALRDGLDPTTKPSEPDAVPDFREAATQCHNEMKGAWRNPKHAAQWLSTLEAHAFPKIGSTPINLVDGPMIRDLLSPIWLRIPETAKRVHQRVGAVLDFSMAKGWRQSETPTRSVLKGLPKQKRRDTHFSAMPFADVPAFCRKLSELPPAVGRSAVLFTILTAARSGEVRGATWSEIDLVEKVWRVPADRMKAGREHLVPLTARSISILASLEDLRNATRSKLLFPGRPRGAGKADTGISDMTMTKALRDLNVPVTVHGFRSSFRDWAAEETDVPSEVVEKALAHTIPNKVEAAYRRTDFLEKRRKLMDAWAMFVMPGDGAQSA